MFSIIFFKEQRVNKITFYCFIKFEKKKLSSLMLKKKKKKWRKRYKAKRENLEQSFTKIISNTGLNNGNIVGLEEN